MSSRYYPYGIFCNKFGCWCDDVVDITDGNNDCNGDCGHCDYSSDPQAEQKETYKPKENQAICGNCHKFVKIVPVKNPRSKGEVEFVCKTCGVIDFVEFRKR